jgi:hypothetical protein
MEELFSVPSLPGLYNQLQLQVRDILETRRVGGWRETVASLRGRVPGSRETSTVESVESCSCDRGRFGNPEEGKCLPLEAGAKPQQVETENCL